MIILAILVKRVLLIDKVAGDKIFLSHRLECLVVRMREEERFLPIAFSFPLLTTVADAAAVNLGSPCGWFRSC